MMLILTCLVVLAMLLANEAWARRYGLRDELSRKVIHIAVGSFVAFWPFYLSWGDIRLLSLVFLIGVVLSKRFNLFKTVHSVTRPSWGEVAFALAVGLVTLITTDRWIYAAALLQMSLADGLAAVIGVRFGKGNTYKVRGMTKSLAGSVTFMSVSYLILLSFAVFISPLNIGWCLGVAAAATVLENTAWCGLDNLLVPVFVAVALCTLMA